MPKVPINMRLDADLLAEVDRHAGPGGRTRFFETAARQALGEEESPPARQRPTSSSPGSSLDGKIRVHGEVTPRVKP